MERYLVAKPLRFVQINDRQYLMSEPAKGSSKVNINEYVLGFLKLIGNKDYLKVSEVEEYLKDKSQEFQLEYYTVFKEFIDEDILIPFD